LKQTFYSQNYEDRKDFYRHLKECIFNPGAMNWKMMIGDKILLTHRGERDAVAAVGTIQSEPFDVSAAGRKYLCEWHEDKKLQHYAFDCWQGGTLREEDKAIVLKEFDISYAPIIKTSSKKKRTSKKRTSKAAKAIAKAEAEALKLATEEAIAKAALTDINSDSAMEIRRCITEKYGDGFFLNLSKLANAEIRLLDTFAEWDAKHGKTS
tara:strand:+ start:1110 stop:1736 length:627 start_codon:yes stop_codon:yes gene_type:complete